MPQVEEKSPKKMLKEVKKVQNLQPKKPALEQKKQIINTVTIDADGRILGRLSTEIAVILRGKNKPSFRPNLAMGDKVIVLNARKIKVTGGKETKKLYYRHSGYLGHLKTFTYNEIFTKNPADILKHAVMGMLPKNKLRQIWIKNLEIRNEE